MLTRVLIAINVIVFGWELATGALATNGTLEAHGALYGPDVFAGEWWRIFTSAFLHGGWAHIGFNMFALWQVGTIVELIYGTPRMGIIYFIAALGSGLLVTVVDTNEVTIGASGAIFGLFGALVVAALRLGPAGRALLNQCIGVIVLNLIIGFTLPNISNSGHIGGLIAGFLAGGVLYRRRVQLQPQQQPQPAYAQHVDLRHEPGVVTIEHAPDPPREVAAEHEPPR